MSKKIIIICLFFICCKLQAQSTAENKLGTWYMYNGSNKVLDKFSLKTMAHFRYYEHTNKFQQEIYRLGFNYSFNPKTNITLGAAYSTGDLEYDVPSTHLYEYRFYEDLNLKSNWGKFNAAHRIRLEHRFIHKNITEDVTQSWVRYNLNVGYPLSKKWSAYVFNEIFLNIDRGRRFVQNWTGAGFLHKVNESLKLKMGYFQIKSPTTVLKRLQLGIILNTDFTKKTI